MKQNITCPCGRGFSVVAEEAIDLDASPEYIGKITDGSFMSFTCPGCGKTHKPEFPVRLLWPSQKITLEVLPELDRGEFYRRKTVEPGVETVIGYPELADRIAVIRDGLEPAAIETLKYYLLLKAEENYPEQEIRIWYQGKNAGGVEFHLHGIKAGEVAITRVPISVYEKTLADFRERPGAEVFTSLRTRSYLSVQNMLRPELLK
ncbi:MAG: CpXC domain-containing protein [Treponema sp.]|jgi:hypothetical protein|nr:CpXC domain-containing protein [Treponema sp.]